MIGVIDGIWTSKVSSNCGISTTWFSILRHHIAVNFICRKYIPDIHLYELYCIYKAIFDQCSDSLELRSLISWLNFWNVYLTSKHAWSWFSWCWMIAQLWGPFQTIYWPGMRLPSAPPLLVPVFTYIWPTKMMFSLRDFFIDPDRVKY